MATEGVEDVGYMVSLASYKKRLKSLEPVEQTLYVPIKRFQPGYVRLSQEAAISVRMCSTDYEELSRRLGGEIEEGSIFLARTYTQAVLRRSQMSGIIFCYGQTTTRC